MLLNPASAIAITLADAISKIKGTKHRSKFIDKMAFGPYNAKTENAVAFINGEVVGILQNVPTNRFVKRIMIGGDVFAKPAEYLLFGVCHLFVLI